MLRLPGHPSRRIRPAAARSRRLPNALPFFETALDLFPAARTLRRWAIGLSVSTIALLAIACMLHDWRMRSPWPVLFSLGVVGLGWALTLAQCSARTSMLARLDRLLWINDVVLIGLGLLTLIFTGGGTSPLTWLYVPLILVETLSDYRRGWIVAWLAWIASAGVLLLPLIPSWPSAVFGFPTAMPKPDAASIGHLIGPVLWWRRLLGG